VRLYAPDTGGPHPVLVYFHGGGWVIGSLDAYDGSARALCREAGCIVASVAYRQAPEHRFPAAAEDAHAATQWAFQNAESFGGDPERVAIAGESAGGNLATVACLMAKEEGGAMPLHQLLVYPVTKYNADFLSYAENRDAKPLNAAMMAWFWSHYLPSEEAGSDWRASPLAAPDLAGLPPATVLTAEADPLRDEGEAYAERLKNSGVPTKLTRYEGMPHEFFGMGAVVADARRAVQEAATALKGAFERPALRRTVER
jgi:acetyl esterase